MSGIIDKLGIKRIEPFSTLDLDKNMKFRYDAVMEMQQQNRDMLKALIRSTVRLERFTYNSIVDDNIETIEKVTSKTWEEVKELNDE